MAKQKHGAPLEDSDDERQVPNPHPEQEDSSQEVKEGISSDEDADTDESEDEPEKHVLLPRKPQPQMVSKPSSSSSEDESDSEPESDPEPVLENGKPSSKLKSPPSSAVSEAKSGSKRKAKNSIDHSKSKLKSEPLDSKEGKMKSELSGTSLALTSMLRYNGAFGKPFREDYIRKGLELLGDSKREEIEARWRKLRDAENKLYAEIAAFYAEQVKLIYQANSSSSS